MKNSLNIPPPLEIEFGVSIPIVASCPANPFAETDRSVENKSNGDSTDWIPASIPEDPISLDLPARSARTSAEDDAKETSTRDAGTLRSDCDPCEGRDASPVAAERSEPRTPRMVKSELLGQHSFETSSGRQVHIYKRNGAFMLRGRLPGRQFGERLGTNEREAEMRLHEILADLGAGTYRPPSDPARRTSPPRRVPRATLRELCNSYCHTRRHRKGKKTAHRYRNHLQHVLAFSEQPDIMRRFPLAKTLDRTFVVELREFLLARTVAPNGRRGGPPRPMASSTIVQILNCLRAVLNHACGSDVALLPADFVNPVDRDLIGSRPKKPPIRKLKLPLERRVRLVRVMDRWQLIHLSLSLVLPLRPEDFAGLLINDVEWKDNALRFETRWNGRDFSKGHQSFMVPFPPELRPVLTAAVGGRTEGPVFRSRRVFEGRRSPAIVVAQPGDLTRAVNEALATEKPTTEQDGKTICRRMIREAGGVSTDELARDFKRLCCTAGIEDHVPFYACREAVTTELERVGMPVFHRRFITGHTLSDILNVYTALSLDEIKKSAQLHWNFATELLKAIVERADQLGV